MMIESDDSEIFCFMLIYSFIESIVYCNFGYYGVIGLVLFIFVSFIYYIFSGENVISVRSEKMYKHELDDLDVR
jgi:hypothetical protein